MRHVDGRLSDRASATWPGSLVVKDVALEVEHVDGNPHNSEVANLRTIRVETWLLERPGADPVDLGGYYMAAVRALGAMIRAEKRTQR